MKLTILMVLAFVVLLYGCNNDNLNSDSNVVCNSPYIRFERGCCLDTNNNSICDNDENSITGKVIDTLDVKKPSNESIETNKNLTDYKNETKLGTNLSEFSDLAQKNITVQIINKTEKVNSLDKNKLVARLEECKKLTSLNGMKNLEKRKDCFIQVAIDFKELSVCMDYLTKDEDRELCLFKMTYILNDITICEELGQDYIYRCYFDFALSSNNSTYCGKIIKPCVDEQDEYNECVRDLRRDGYSPDDVTSWCYDSKIAYDGCLTKDADSCFYQIALNTENLSICANIKTPINRTCYGILEKNISRCNDMSNEISVKKYKDECYISIAVVTSNILICQTKLSNDRKEECIDRVNQ